MNTPAPDPILVRLYEKKANTPSDINEHLPTLRRYSSQVGSVVEMGVRGVVSTWAFLLGLAESRAQAKSLIGVDIMPCDYEAPTRIAAASGIDVSFVQENSATVVLPARDLLFIDTWHCYGHLKRELMAHHASTMKYIIMHDTTVDEWDGEAVRCNHDVGRMARESGYPEHEVRRGVWPACHEFLIEHPEWTVAERSVNNNGLTVLARMPRTGPEVASAEPSPKPAWV